MKMDFIADKTEEYEQLIRKRLSDYRFEHSMNVAKAAVYLAEKYGADKGSALAAGLLHDIMKEEERALQIAYIEAGGHILTAEERANPSVLHQMSGAAYCKAELGIEDKEILNAIRFHTTGRAGMTLLEKIIYVADLISADRNYPDVETVRCLAKESLDKTMLYLLKYTISDLVKKEKVIHPDTLNCFNFMIENNFEKE